MPKLKTIYICSNCEYETSKWLGKCPSCNNFNTFEESVIEKSNNNLQSAVHTPSSVSTLSSIEHDLNEKRLSSKIVELDRVLNGGFVDGSLTLIGGDPGIGKSTLILQVCENICVSNNKILYVSGEESVSQIKMRAKRLNVTSENLLLMSETNIGVVESTIKSIIPSMVIIDSIQTIYDDSLSQAPGSVVQVRECTALLMRLAKGMNISIIIVGHVTKEGSIAGPRILEHMVDTVLYFEGERHASYRIVRSVKNRFGPSNEIGVFEMQDKGLIEIKNPSEYMLSGRPLQVPGSVVTASMEGTRPILTEVQALVSYTNFGMPRRTANGLDYNRVVMLIAVLEKRLGMALSSYDSYVNIAGGLKIAEPSLDAAVITAIAGSYRNKIVDPYTMVFGEVGLTGEIRAVSMAEKRVQEASKLGFKTCIAPQANLKWLKPIDGMRIFGAANINELLELLD